MNHGRLYAVRCPLSGQFLSVPAGRKAAVFVPLAEARLYKDRPSAARVAAGSDGVVVGVDLAVNTSVQTYVRDGDRFLFSRNGAACDPPPGWRDVPADQRVAFLSATGWIPT